MIRRLAASAAAAAIVVAALTGCASPSLDTSFGDQLQTSVVEVASAAAGGDLPGAIVQLDEVQAQLQEAIDAEAVTAARAARIQTAIDAVRADLEALVPPAPAPAPEPAPVEPGTDGVDDGDQGNGNDNSGPGNNNGNSGKDKDKGKGD
ncbi:hypothetical protein [Microbacterium sp. SS28]|uniref:hypothetical protein n=1 Tax=Microbacterium sp. SS28 TaxID=2919948 RepID=UPI001FA9FFEA|nr:hypothetical protein [Microbacterium sp. SS28]